MLISGTERFSTYSGYRGTFRWGGDAPDGFAAAPRTVITAFDALFFARKDYYRQFSRECVLRELDKAASAFASRCAALGFRV